MGVDRQAGEVGPPAQPGIDPGGAARAAWPGGGRGPLGPRDSRVPGKVVTFRGSAVFLHLRPSGGAFGVPNNPKHGLPHQRGATRLRPIRRAECRRRALEAVAGLHGRRRRDHPPQGSAVGAHGRAERVRARDRRGQHRDEGARDGPAEGRQHGLVGHPGAVGTQGRGAARPPCRPHPRRRGHRPRRGVRLQADGLRGGPRAEPDRGEGRGTREGLWREL
mmetsp:Transcript_7686/g.23367  ORF Transcript_7686/g.23367 Transcript_7686/m.23367 type:complete len:220 (-) Transcript_7686:488-1147(-)